MDEAKVTLYVQMFDSAIKLIGQQLIQGNGPLMLRNLLPKLIEINNELISLDSIIDAANKGQQNGAAKDKEV